MKQTPRPATSPRSTLNLVDFNFSHDAMFY